MTKNVVVAVMVFQASALYAADDPAGKQFPAKSNVIAGLQWLGNAVPYPEAPKRGDTFPLTWAADGHQYTSAGDPHWPSKRDGINVIRMVGEAPDYTMEDVNPMPDYRGSGGRGAKSTGMISVNGTLYMVVQNLTRKHKEYEHGYDAHVFASKDYGKTWTPDLKDVVKSGKLMFPGRTFASAAFVNFGKDNAGARDEYVYAISGEGWDNGDHGRLARVPVNRIMDITAWEWVKGFGPGRVPQWTSSMEESTPVLSIPGFLGYLEMVYVAKLKRYMLLTWHHKKKSSPDDGSELLILDSPEPWGPYTLVYHEDLWETKEMNPYNPRVPLKWFDQEKLEGWLLFSGSWRDSGRTPFYRAHIRKFRLVLPEKGPAAK